MLSLIVEKLRNNSFLQNYSPHNDTKVVQSAADKTPDCLGPNLSKNTHPTLESQEPDVCVSGCSL